MSDSCGRDLTVVEASGVSRSPMRLQRSRRRGSRLTSPNGLLVVCVTRGTLWGNPFRVSSQPGDSVQTAHALAVESFRRALLRGELAFSVDDVRKELCGRNLACWCSLPVAGAVDVCHAAVLMEVANG